MQQYIEDHYKHWQHKYVTMSVRQATKFTGGVDTKVPSITFYVKSKGGDHTGQIPKNLGGYLTDVVELSTLDYKLGVTSMTNKSPEQQRKMASGVRKLRQR